MSSRTLTNDERKAAEAAFRGEPFNPKWSPAARRVYDGILKSLVGSSGLFMNESPAEPAGTPDARSSESGSSAGARSAEVRSSSEPDANRLTQAIMSRAEAIKEGLLIDVTPLAVNVGLQLPVGITRPLWDVGVTASHTLTEEQHQARVRDILVALRLHLSASPLVSPVVQFPALLAFPPDPVPQVCLLCAVVHKDKTNPQALTLVLPHEIGTMFSSFSN